VIEETIFILLFKAPGALLIFTTLKHIDCANDGRSFPKHSPAQQARVTTGLDNGQQAQKR